MDPRQYGLNGLEQLAKGVDASNFFTMVPQDLEKQAHNVTWSPDSAYELSFMKTVPITRATSVTHEYNRFNKYSNRKRRFGNFSERALPPSGRFDATRRSVTLKLVGEMSEVFMLAALENSVQALGTTGAVNIEQNAVTAQVLGLQQQAFLFSDTSTTRLGSASTRVRGLIQALREGTDGTEDTSPIGSHVIDLKGAPLSQSTLRDYVTEIIQAFGAPNMLYMSPKTRSGFEQSLDGTYFTPLPLSDAPYVLGQQARGFSSQGADVTFATDNMLQPDHPLSARGRYDTVLDEEAPSSAPTINSVVAGSGSNSEWDQASAGDIFYIVAETVNELQGIGRRYPASTSAYVAVAEGQVVTLNVTPGAPLADSFVVYRGKSGDSDEAHPYFAFEVANSGGGAAVSFVDRNHDRPNTETAFLLSINSAAQKGMATARNFASLQERSADFYGMADDENNNTVSRVHLGPPLISMQLAAILATASRPLVCGAMTSQVRQPRKNIIFKNIGRV